MVKHGHVELEIRVFLVFLEKKSLKMAKGIKHAFDWLNLILVALFFI